MLMPILSIEDGVEWGISMVEIRLCDRVKTKISVILMCGQLLGNDRTEQRLIRTVFPGSCSYFS
jgi:hypothetical protein